jgi:SpoVK/Ycf46/Vps4 family AAA+-type ATPase
MVIAATNRPFAIDPTLLRSGRLDTHLYVGLPSEHERSEILKLYVSKYAQLMQLEKDPVDLSSVILKTEGYSPAELHSLVRRAFMEMQNRDGKNLSETDWQNSLNVVLPITSHDELTRLSQWCAADTTNECHI